MAARTHAWIRLVCAGLAACAMAHARGADIADTIGQRMQPCMACHGQEGRATTQGFFPRIAGKPAGYLYNQLIAFPRRPAQQRDDGVPGRPHDRRLPAGDRRLLRRRSTCPTRRRARPGARRRSSRAARRWCATATAARGMPACAACHGEALTGVAAGDPGLLGLPRDYLLAAVRLLADRRAPRAGARLHGPDRVAPDAART